MGGKNSTKPTATNNTKIVKESEESKIIFLKLVLSKTSFEYLGIIGKGGFGKVWKVYYKKYKKAYAMKEMSKAKIIDKKSEKSIKYERDLLSKMKHP
jgi:serine/threonine kinase 32